MTYAPTLEQAAAVEAFASGENVAIHAAAGSGKTSTLRFIADSAVGKRGLYMAFNRSVADDAKRRFSGTGVVPSTVHALAYREFGAPLRHRLNQQRLFWPQKASIIGASDKFPVGSTYLTRQTLVRLAEETVKAFCRSMDKAITAETAVMPSHIILMPREEARLRQKVAEMANAYWNDWMRPDGRIPVTHDCYLKLWALSEPVLNYDYLLVDEAQDLEPLTRGVLNLQDTQVVAVGDPNQAIYGWRGAESAMNDFGGVRTNLTQCQPPGTMVTVPVPAPRVGVPGVVPVRFEQVPIESLRAGDKVVSWTQRRGVYRRGNSVAGVSRRMYSGQMTTVRVGDLTSRYTDNHECVVVLGDKLADGDHVVYLMRRGDQFRIGRCPWRYSSGVAPIRRAVREGADELWVLSVHRTVEEASFAEAIAQHRFGIPGVLWNNTEETRSRYKMNVDAFWAEVGDNPDAAERCLAHHDLLIEHPLWRRVPTSDALGAWQGKTKPSRPNPPGPRHRAGWSTVTVTAAANLRSGMLMLPLDSVGELNEGGGSVPWSKWQPAAVSRERYEGWVYSISVEDDHTYIADGIVTHNCFRFGDAIADEANLWLETLDADIRVQGLAGKASSVHPSRRIPEAVLTRTNGGTIREVLDAQAAGRSVGVAGERKVNELTALAKAAVDLQTKGTTSHRDLDVFTSWRDVVNYVEEEREDADIAALVDVVENYGAQKVLDAIERCVPPAQAEQVISTAHIAKGLEWFHVRISDDFREPALDKATGERKPMKAEEARLAYVAVTRAQRHLDPGGLSYIRNGGVRVEGVDREVAAV